MLTSSKHTILLLNILEILEQQIKPISSKQLTELIGIYSQPKILSACKKLQDIIMNVSNKDRLSINHAGIFFERKPSNLSYLYEEILKDDIEYEILKKLFSDRTFDTLNFCYNYGISESSLKRTIQEINTSFIDYDLHISVAKMTKLSGSEHHICLNFYYFLWSVHRELKNIPWIKDVKKYYQVANQLHRFLELESTEASISLFALRYFVIENTQKKGKFISFEQNALDSLENFFIPEIPPFLKDWHYNNWLFLYLTIFASSYSDASYKVSQLEMPIFYSLSNLWIDTFKTYFDQSFNLDPSLIRTRLLKEWLSATFLYIKEDDLIQTISLNDSPINFYRNKYPDYFSIFEHFWNEIQHSFSPFKTSFVKSNNLMLCTMISPPNEYIRQINIFIFSDINFYFEEYLKTYLQYKFDLEFKLNFVNNYKEADILIGTANYYLDILTTNQPYLIIHPSLSMIDLKELKRKLKEITEK